MTDSELTPASNPPESRDTWLTPGVAGISPAVAFGYAPVWMAAFAAAGTLRVPER
ncbi:hypothetical protein [Nocardia nova]|uniref:hypothetical protein n=1 Tax=Nocardia nova TaxID=37330 RepID=UPI003403DA9C